MKILTGFLLVAALVAAVFLRFHHLDVTPFHADEAVQAFIFQDLLEAGHYQYDPHHYHGPLPHYVNWLWMKAAGHKTLLDLTETDFRILPALAGCLLVVAIAAAAYASGNLLAAIVAALLAATSPLLVFFSRFGLHEMLFALCGFLASWAALALLQKPALGRAAVFGGLVALTAACKETWIFLALAWLVAAAVVLATKRCRPTRQLVRCLAVAVGVFLVGILLLFGHGFLDFWRSYFIYETNSGHNKPLVYYARELFPQGAQWCGEPWLWLAAICLAGWLGWGKAKEPFPLPAQFLGLCGVVTLVIFSLIPYKTPWLMVLPMALCLPAAAWLCVQHGKSPAARALIMAMVAALLVWQTRCTWLVSQKRFWDAGIPLVYSPSSLNAPKLRAFLLKTAAGQPIAVFGRDYWPLPWYLRGFKVGYFDTPQERGNFGVLIYGGENLNAKVSGTGIQESLWGVRTDYLVRTVTWPK